VQDRDRAHRRDGGVPEVRSAQLGDTYGVNRGRTANAENELLASAEDVTEGEDLEVELVRLMRREGMRARVKMARTDEEFLAAPRDVIRPGLVEPVVRCAQKTDSKLGAS